MERSAEKAKEFLTAYESTVKGRYIYMKTVPTAEYWKWDNTTKRMKLTYANAEALLKEIEEYADHLRKELEERRTLVAEVGETVNAVDAVLEDVKKRKQPEATASPPLISVVATPIMKAGANVRR